MKKQMQHSQQTAPNQLPLVSVIMSVYNAQNFLGEAIESILNQTLKDFEFFIIDDYSSDESWKIIKRYAKKDKRIKLFRNTKNKGLAKSLNILISKTRGTFVARMDADDISLPNRLTEQIDYLKMHPDIVACGGQEYIIDESGKIIDKKHFPTDPDKAYNWIMNFMIIQPPLLMGRGEIIRKCQFDTKLFANDDIPFHFELLKYGKFGNVNKIIFKYRRLLNSLTHKEPKKIYFQALRVRLNAIKNLEYRPSLLNFGLAIGETILVALIPNQVIIWLFEQARFGRKINA